MRLSSAAVKPVDLNAMFQSLPEQPEAVIPAACIARMHALRTDLTARGATVSRRALNDAWRFCGIMLAALEPDTDPLSILDLAVAQRILPGLLANAPLGALAEFPTMLADLPCSRALLDQPLPVMI